MNVARYDHYRRSFAGTIEQDGLQPVDHRGDGEHLYYVCLACGPHSGHYAARRTECFGMSTAPASVLHCYSTGRKWLILRNAARTIDREETAFNGLLDRHALIVGSRVTAAEAFRLYTERGCPPELLDIDDPLAFGRLLDEHRARGRKAKQ